MTPTDKGNVKAATPEAMMQHGYIEIKISELAALRIRLEALEKWGQEVTNLLNRGLFIDSTDEITSGNLFDQARTLGLVGEDRKEPTCPR